MLRSVFRNARAASRWIYAGLLDRLTKRRRVVAGRAWPPSTCPNCYFSVSRRPSSIRGFWFSRRPSLGTRCNRRGPAWTACRCACGSMQRPEDSIGTMPGAARPRKRKARRLGPWAIACSCPRICLFAVRKFPVLNSTVGSLNAGELGLWPLVRAGRSHGDSAQFAVDFPVSWEFCP